jgi:hypothetical protein
MLSAGDSAYGDYDVMREWIENNGKCYVLCVSAKEYVSNFVRDEYDGTKVCIGGITKNLPSEGWLEASVSNEVRDCDGSKGARVYDWLTLETGSEKGGKKHTLLFRRSKGDSTEIRAYICYAQNGTKFRIDTPAQKLVEIAGTRWTVEMSFGMTAGHS